VRAPVCVTRGITPGPEEEKLVARLQKFGEEDGPANVVAGIVVAVTGPRQTVAVPEEIVGVQGFIALEIIAAAVEFLGAGT
jgi:hypothetical protein